MSAVRPLDIANLSRQKVFRLAPNLPKMRGLDQQSEDFSGSSDLPDQRTSRKAYGSEDHFQQQRIDRRRLRNESAGNGGHYRNSRTPDGGEGRGGGNHGRFRGRGDIEFKRQGAERHNRDPRSRPGLEEHRYWCSAGHELPDVHDKFVIVSYNILADKNASEHYHGLYYHIPWRLMNWERRKNKLVQELGLWSPDIMCLQEVDQFEDLLEEFEKRGYQGAYKGRTGGALDGCAMFWRSTRFRLLQEENLQFNELGLKDNVAQLCALQSIGVRGNRPSDIGGHQPVSSSSGNVVIVGNIHVLFNPKRGDIKLGQVRLLLESAHALSKKWNEAPVVIGGDFNSTPASCIYQYVANSELDISSLNRQNLSGQVEADQGSSWKSPESSGRFPKQIWRQERIRHMDVRSVSPMDSSSAEPDSGASTAFVSFTEATVSSHEWTTSSTTTPDLFQGETSAVADSPEKFVKKWVWTPEEIVAATGTLTEKVVRHKLRLRSAYTEIEGESGCRDPQGEPLVTTYHKKFMGTVDYIWHTEGLDTVKVLDTLPVNVLQRCQGLPSQKWGSDHLALACEFAFHPRKLKL